jgi:hypothetical protein
MPEPVVSNGYVFAENPTTPAPPVVRKAPAAPPAPPVAPSEPAKPRKRLVLILVAAVVLVGIAAYIALGFLSATVSPKPAAGDPDRLLPQPADDAAFQRHLASDRP